MRNIVSCEFNIDTACVELCLEDGTLLSIDCTAVENEVANSMYQRSELDWLIYNDPLAYAELILNGNIANYLKSVSYMKAALQYKCNRKNKKSDSEGVPC